MLKLINYFKKNKFNIIKNLIGSVIGGLAGYLYYFFIGCSNGSCAITSNPYKSIIYGLVLGFLLFSFFDKKNKKKNKDKN